MNAGAPSPRGRAEAAQLAASDPSVSAFVAASAGSGKTKLLTDRLLRLLLGGADPSRIQCLTFTKAAAAEMALRLQDRLGRWAIAPDDALARDLARLGVDATPEALTAARALFARVLDLAGGMRIGTIHAFCQSLLRRFPLEAAISPHFALLEGADQSDTRRGAREAAIADAAREADVALLAATINFDEVSTHVDALTDEPDRLRDAAALGDALESALRRALGATHATEDALMADAVAWPEEDAVRDMLRAIAERGTKDGVKRALPMLDWLALPVDMRIETWDAFACGLLTTEGTAHSRLIGAALKKSWPGIEDIFAAECARALRVADSRRAIRAAAISAAATRLALPMARGYAARKEQAGRLDYDDLIARTAALLREPGAAWVLYKLDGGLDHLLLDEVQDTAPSQWRIAHALIAEFFAGQGARDGARDGAPRTVFAVGDRKQSIFSFQGADAEVFDASRERLRALVEGAGAGWRAVPLDVSFRSTVPVLALVDAVFAEGDARDGVVPPGETLAHQADRQDAAGWVTLWPLVPKTEKTPVEDWVVPDANAGQDSAPERLARKLAAWIAEKTTGGMMLESRGRPLRPGDVMVLVQRRGDFSRALVRALKQAGVPVAGEDRMTLADQPGVADLIALCEALLLPEDDLTLATVLRSPVGELSEQSLYDLAQPRDGTLWRALRDRAAERPDWGRAAADLGALLARVDHATPHALLSEALGPRAGRARLLRRLGPEAREAIDALLAAALAFQRTHPPSLQGFVHWLSRSGMEIKREPEGNAQDAAGPGAVRLMTVHGAKGLQAPLVILPATLGATKADAAPLWLLDDATGRALPVVVPRKELCSDAARALRDARAAAGRAEANRLLYVALTRAEDHLLVCGWATQQKAACAWYEAVKAGMGRLRLATPPRADVAEDETGIVTITVPQDAPPAAVAAVPTVDALPLPAWAGHAPDWRALAPPEETAPIRLAPSRPEDAQLGPVPAQASPLTAPPGEAPRFRRGRLIHELLQHLPSLPPEARDAAARVWLARPAHADIAAGVAEEVGAVLAHPALGPLFGPGSRAEVPLTGLVAGQVLGGLVDRLAVLPDRVLVADYKTNRAPPGDPAQTPVLYLRQMAAYRALLRAVHPDKPVVCVLIWTRAPRVDLLSDALLDPHAPGMHDRSLAAASPAAHLWRRPTQNEAQP